MARSCHVAVIGAGVAGLVAARELLREGHRVVIFEKSNRIGGTWVYDQRVEADPLGLDPDREIIHSSLYRSLRTNLPRQIMGFLDYPFRFRGGREDGDPRAFPRHEEVLAFIEDFADHYRLLDLVRFHSHVVRVHPCGRNGDGWVVDWESSDSESKSKSETFQAIVICNGHFTEPRIARISGIEKWPGKQIHSHNYRTPEPFQDQIVVLIGNGPSAYDISREISKVAKQVHLTSRSMDAQAEKLEGHDNIWQHSMIKYVNEDGTVVFHDGSSLLPAIILHCTGFKYHFPFLETDAVVSIDDNRVEPLYKHVFPPHLAPWISFVGIPSKVIPSLVCEFQSRWIAQVLSSKVTLPKEEEMMASVEEYYQIMEESGRPKHHTHNIYPNACEYKNWLLAQIGLPPLEEWIESMYVASIKSLLSNINGYRDEWDEEYWSQHSDSITENRSHRFEPRMDG